MKPSLRARQDARTVLLRMAHDEARAQRIRDLKARHEKDVTWREIADAVGVSERSAHDWAATGAMKKANAVKLAEFFRDELGEEIDADYVWRGLQPAARTPDLMKALAKEDASPDLTRRLEYIQRGVLENTMLLRELARRAGIDLPTPQEVARQVVDLLEGTGGEDPPSQPPPDNNGRGARAV